MNTPDHRDDTPGEAAISSAAGQAEMTSSATEGAGSTSNLAPVPSGPPCEKCGETLGFAAWDLGLMRCAECDPAGEHIAGDDGCRICGEVCPTCSKPRWSTAP